jgi:outer membrane cobalamin receptor
MTCGSRATLLLMLILCGPASGADQSSPSSDQSTTMDEVIVTGTRVQGLKAADSLAPVQIVGADALNKVGEFDLSEGLLQTVPSFNLGAGAANGDVGACSPTRASGASARTTRWCWSTASGATARPTWSSTADSTREPPAPT